MKQIIFYIGSTCNVQKDDSSAEALLALDLVTQECINFKKVIADLIFSLYYTEEFRYADDNVNDYAEYKD